MKILRSISLVFPIMMLISINNLFAADEYPGLNKKELAVYQRHLNKKANPRAIVPASSQVDLSNMTVFDRHSREFKKLSPWKTRQDLQRSFPNHTLPLAGIVLLKMIPSVLGSGSELSDEGELFSMGMAVIVARELIEAVIIMGGVRTAIDTLESIDEVERSSLKRRSTRWAVGSGTAALLMVVGIGTGLHYASGEIDEETQELIEGISKIIASMFVAKLALKIPQWCGLYPKRPGEFVGQEILDNPKKFFFWQVGWNIFREISEIGLFMIPYALAGSMEAFPISAAAGVGIAGISTGVHWLLKKCSTKKTATIVMTTITGLLAAGLMSTGCHEIEEVAGETPEAWDLGDDVSHKELPWSVARPFGYSSHPTIVETVSWWVTAAAQGLFHYYYANRNFDNRDDAIELGER